MGNFIREIIFHLEVANGTKLHTKRASNRNQKNTKAIKLEFDSHVEVFSVIKAGEA